MIYIYTYIYVHIHKTFYVELVGFRSGYFIDKRTPPQGRLLSRLRHLHFGEGKQKSDIAPSGVWDII